MERGIAELWASTAAAMPESWHLDSLRCTSTGLAADERSEGWLAVAVGPDGAEVRTAGATPESALEALRRAVPRPRHGPE